MKRPFPPSATQITAGFILTTLAISSLAAPAWADKVLKNLREPISVQVQSEYDSKTTNKGQAFQGVTTEDYVYQNSTLPAGTVFKGFVQEVKPSRRYARPGYFVMDIQQVVLPSGESHQMSLVQGMGAESQGVDTKKINNKKARTVKRFVKESLPMQLASSGTSIPLGVATSLNGGIVFAIATGARMTAGAVVELMKDERQNGVTDKIVYGMWRGTGIPGTYEFFNKDKQAHFNEGAMMPLRMDPDAVKGLFMLKSLVHEPLPAYTEKSAGMKPEVAQPESADSTTQPAQPTP